MPELAQILAGLDSLHTRFDDFFQLIGSRQLDQAWYSLRQAARLKRGLERHQDENGNVREQESFLNTLRARQTLQPRGGNPDGHVGGVAVWHRKTIMDWLLQSDEELQRVGERGGETAGVTQRPGSTAQ